MVVQAPVGAVVESIPEGYEKLIINGETYYIVDGVQYKAVVYDGEIWYEVIKFSTNSQSCLIISKSRTLLRLFLWASHLLVPTISVAPPVRGVRCFAKTNVRGYLQVH